MSVTHVIEQHPNPGALPVKLRCRNCIHYEHSPAFKVGGKMYVCGSKEVGRDSGADPCTLFKFDPIAHTKLSPRTKILLRKLMVSVRKESIYKNRTLEAIMSIVTFLVTEIRLNSRGFQFYQRVGYGEGRIGKLLYLDKNTALIEGEGGITYQVPVDTISKQTTKEKLNHDT